ncbi:hypothetical protein KSS87_002440, partial [Heliosperma pusillum]
GVGVVDEWWRTGKGGDTDDGSGGGGCSVQSGYMAPEYLFHGQFSVKLDVYSLGVLVLEIISGRRIIGPPNRSGGHEGLLSYAWRCWEDGKPLEIMDPTLTDLCSRTEVLKCVQLGLLCVEEDYTMRPCMSTIVHILSSNFAATALSKPQHPAFIYPANSYKSTIGNHKFTN